MRSSAIFLVSVVTRTRSPLVTRSLICSMRSSIWPLVGLTITSGSTRPVGRTICSTTCDDIRSSYSAGVADRKTTWLRRSMTSSKRSGRLSRALGEPEPVLDERVLPAAVALVLAVQLRHGHVALVDDEQEVVGEVVDQGERRLAGAAAVDVHRVVLDAVAVADLLDHLQVVLGAHAEALGLEQLALGLEPRQPLLQLGLDAHHGPPHPLVAGDVVGGREDDDLGEVGELLAGERVDDGEPLDGVAEHLDAQHRLLVGGVHLDGVAPHAELAPAERHVVAVVLQVDEAAQDRALVVVDAGVQLEQLAPVLLRVAHAVDAADAGHDDHVPPGEQRRRWPSGAAGRSRR